VNKFLSSAFASVKNASGLAHTVALVIASGVVLYGTSSSYKATVLAVWAMVPGWLKLIAGVVGPPALIYWNSQKKNGNSTSGTGTGMFQSPAAKMVAICFLVLGISVTQGCASFSTVLSDISSSLGKFAPLLVIAEGAVCVVTGPACSLVTSFVTTAEPFAVQLESAFTAWSSASAAAAPGDLNQVIAALGAWQAQLKAGLNIPGLSAAQQAQYNPMIMAELNAATDFATTLQAAQQAGGTTKALAQVIEEAQPIEVGGPDDYLAFWDLTKVFRLVRAPRTFKLKNGAVVHSWAYHKAQLLEKMSKKTGDAQVDAWRAKCIAQIKSLG